MSPICKSRTKGSVTFSTWIVSSSMGLFEDEYTFVELHFQRPLFVRIQDVEETAAREWRWLLLERLG